MPPLMESVINWLKSNITFDTILTVVGFVIAYLELRKTKSAVLASKQATEKTIQLLSDRSTIADLATITNGLRETQTALRGLRYEAALLRLQDLRGKLHELRSRENFTNNERLTEIQKMIFTLRRMQETLEICLSTSTLEKFSIHKSNNHLANFVVLMAGWQDEMRYLDRSASHE